MRVLIYPKHGSQPLLTLVLAASLVALGWADILHDQERPQEEVTVTAVEVPVRVLLKGQPVRDLTADDFEVYENGVKQAITHLDIISRVIAGTGISVKKVEPTAIPQSKRRIFILIFDIFDYTDPVGEAVDYFFREIFHSQDSAIVITEDHVLSVSRGQTIEDFAESVKRTLIQFKSISTQNMIKAFRDINREADRLLGQSMGEAPGLFPRFDFEGLSVFYDNYRQIWEAYRNQYLMPDLEFYRNLIQRVRRIEGDKWTICFQQRELFPKIKRGSALESQIGTWIGMQIDPDTQARAQVIQAKQQDLQRSFDLSRVVSPDAMGQLFLSADITFHLILLKSTRHLLEQDWELVEVGEDYEDSLRKISEATGGYLGFSNQAVEALKEAVEVEDFHYLLVYQPKDAAARKERKIEVKVRREGVDVISLKDYVEPVIPITIADLRAGEQTVRFSLLHCQMTSINGRSRGLAEVKISLFDNLSNKVFEERKTLEILREEAHISLQFPQLGPGDYFLVIQAVDQVVNQTDVYSGMIRL